MADELIDYLINTFPNNFISGFENNDILLWGKPDGYNVSPKLISLNVGLNYNPLCIDKDSVTNTLNDKYTSNLRFRNMYDYCKEISITTKVPFIVIVYPTIPQFSSSQWETSETTYPLNNVNFYIRNTSETESIILSGQQLVNYLYQILDVNYTDKGSTKGKNKKINDYFQYWSRNNLSTYIKKIDSDGILINNRRTKYIFVEVKRSSTPPIPYWKPYVEDANNYINQLSFAKALKSQFWLLQHGGKSKILSHSLISYYNIASTNSSEIKRLRELQKEKGVRQCGDYLICSDQSVPLPIQGTVSLLQKINNFIIS